MRREPSPNSEQPGKDLPPWASTLAGERGVTLIDRSIRIPILPPSKAKTRAARSRSLLEAQDPRCAHTTESTEDTPPASPAVTGYPGAGQSWGFAKAFWLGTIVESTIESTED